MDKRILIVKNITREGPGLFEDVLKNRSLAYPIIDFDKGETVPPSDEYAALMVLGGPDSVNDRSEKMQKLLGVVKESLENQKPYLGICLGMQALVKAVGGSVVQTPLKEIGFRDPEGKYFEVELTDAGRQDPLFKDIYNNFPVFHLHGETVTIMDSMTLLGIGQFCRNQIIKINNCAYGIQGHIELSSVYLQQLLTEDSDLQKMDRTSLEKDFAALHKHYTAIGQRFFENFLRCAGFP